MPQTPVSLFPPTQLLGARAGDRGVQCALPLDRSSFVLPVHKEAGDASCARQHWGMLQLTDETNKK